MILNLSSKLENTVKLEKIVVDPARQLYYPESRLKSTEEEVREEKARNHARQQLSEIIPVVRGVLKLSRTVGMLLY